MFMDARRLITRVVRILKQRRMTTIEEMRARVYHCPAGNAGKQKGVVQAVREMWTEEKGEEVWAC